MEEEEEGSGVYIPQQIEHLSDDKLQEAEDLSNPQQCEVVPEMEDSQLVEGSPVDAEEPALIAVADEETPMADVVEMEADVVEMEAEVVEMETEMEVAETSSISGGKRKRGRPARVQSKAPSKTPSKKKTEEDVCFICFDGGNLVLCDRRGCPKAYHPACINRDEAFFRSKGRWNCGWHICSNCEKAAQYMCYTCTNSLCKGCIKEAEFLCVRGNKGFCETCMRTVMLIEKNEQGNKETVPVDFDDKNSWEYLFKDYWIDLKGKLSLTSDELTQARHPWKGSGVLTRKEESSDELYDANDGQGSNSDSSSEHLEVSSSKRRKAKRRSKSKVEDSPSAARGVGSKGIAMSDDIEWASKELLELVAHMKDGDKSVLSQFDVQALLLDYIKRNNLRDPRRKSQIVCDSMLENLFGKARVGHFEMLKLLESHFLIKEDTQVDDVQAGIVDTEASQLEAEGNSEATRAGSDKRRKTRKRGLQTNLDDYAAIDVHNINLLYLRRNLMEDLLEDTDKFNDKVVGSFVRIRISGSGQKQDMYRLVQVVGTGRVAEPYKTGKRTTDITLEILNLNKTEIISIDIISNQEFSEELQRMRNMVQTSKSLSVLAEASRSRRADECKRLRQSIKCGLISRMTVGEVQEKSMALQAVRVNDWLETEILRLSHLRDRASEKGRRKELRECVEKLQLLKTPEERLRRQQEIPEVHADPNMDPSYESEEDEAEPDDKKRENYMRPRDAGFSRKGREPISPGKGGSTSNDHWSGTQKNSTTAWEPSRNMSTKGVWDKGDSAAGAGERMNGSSWNHGRDAHQSNSWEKPRNEAAATGLDTDTWNSQAVVKSGSSSETAQASLSTGVALISETDKIWHYQDPSGKIQGPFSMVQLRKWSTTGYFPVDLRIWKTEKQEDSVLLNDALTGNFHKELPKWDTSFSQPQKGTAASDNNREINWDGGWRGNNSSTWTDKKQSDGQGSGSSGWTAPTLEFKGGQSGNSSHSWDSSKGNNAWSGQSQVQSPHHSPSFSGKPYRTPSHQGREVQGGGRWNPGQNRGNTWNSNRSTGFQPSSGHGYEKQSINWGSSGQSSGEDWRSQPENSSSKGWATPSSVEVPKFATEGWVAAQGSRSELSNLPTPTPKPSSAGWKGGQISENKWSPTPTSPVQPANSGWGIAPSLEGNGARHSAAGLNAPNKTSSGWGEQHHISVTPSAGGWDSSSVSVSMHKPSETSDRDNSIDFLNPPTPTPSQGAEYKLAMASPISVQQTSTGWGSPSNPGGNGAEQSSPTVKGAADWGGQSPTPAKPSVGEWDLGASSASGLKPNETTDGHDAAVIPESGQLTLSSTSPPVSLKPTEVVDGTGASRTLFSQQMNVSGPNAISSLANQSVSDLPRKDDNVTSLSGLVSPSSLERGGGDLIQGSKNEHLSSLHGLSPKADPRIGGLRPADARQIPSQSTTTDEPHGVSQGVLDPQKKSGAQLLTGTEVDGETRPDDVSANVLMETHSFVPEPPPASVRASTNTGVDLVSDVTPSKTADPSVLNWVSSGTSYNAPEENHGWGSDSVQKSEMDPRPGLVSHGWGPVPAQKQEPPTSSPTPAPAVQVLEQPVYGHWGDGPSSEHNSVASLGTVDQAGNHPIPGFSVPDSAPSGNWAGPPNTNSDDQSTSSTALPLTKPSSWDMGPGAAMGCSQNNLLAISDTQRPLISGNQWETGPSMQPFVPATTGWVTGAKENPNVLPPVLATTGWGMGAKENPSTGWRPTPENSNPGWRPPQGNANMGWAGSVQGSMSMGWGAAPQGNTTTGQGTMPQGNANMGWGAPAGSTGMWGNQQKHNGDRFSGHRDWGGGRPSWNRQSSFGSGGGGGGGSSRPPPKGQRVCKYHESGHCKKGADCDYLHP